MGNFSINFSEFFQDIEGYWHDIYGNPFKLIMMLLDLSIVIFILYKSIKSAKRSRGWQLLKGIVLIIFITI